MNIILSHTYDSLLLLGCNISFFSWMFHIGVTFVDLCRSLLRVGGGDISRIIGNNKSLNMGIKLSKLHPPVDICSKTAN